MSNKDLDNLINHLKESGVLKTPLIIDAFKNIDRAEFVPENMKQFSYSDEALPIGGEQTISQPYTVAFMLELLNPQPAEKILDIGSGSGWQASLLAHIVGQPIRKGLNFFSRKGKIFAMEVVPELCRLGKKNISKFNFIEKGTIKWICGDASKEETFDIVKDEISGELDKIIVAAALKVEIPQPWKNLLKVGGRIVVPVENSIWLFIKRGDNDFESIEYPGFVFVPFVYDGNTK